MEGKLVFEGKSSKGRPFLIRYPKRSDIQLMFYYVNRLSSEQTFISYQGEQVSLDFETRYLNNQLELIANKLGVTLLAFSEDTLVGVSSINMKERTSKHTGIFSLSVDADFRGEGIGRNLMEMVLKEAEEKLPSLQIVVLSLFASNAKAREMYEKFGFKEYGRLPKGLLYKGEYIDHEFMYKNIKE